MAIESLTFYIASVSTMTRLARIVKISNISINLQLNSPGTISFTVDKSDNSAYTAGLTPLDKCILVYRDGNLVWSGPILTSEETASGDRKEVSITAIGWAEILNHRLIRSTPGYSLTTSGITFTNATFESALSGWTAANGSVARDTVVFRTGAGSLRLAENIATGLWNGVPIESSMQAAALGSTPTSGKRYRLNFFARARRDARFYNSQPPYVEVLESGVRVGYTALSNLFNSGTHVGVGTVVTETTYTTTGTFIANNVEWVSSGVTPTFRFAWDVNPTQFYDSEQETGVAWNVTTGNYPVDVGSSLEFTTDGAGFFEGFQQGMRGDLDSGKSYTCVVSFFIPVTPVNGSFYVFDNTSASIGSSVNLNTLPPGDYNLTFTFTPTTNVPLGFAMSAQMAVASTFIRMDRIIIKETATDTDNLLNVDDVTLQEYLGDGIYANQDAGAIAIALLNKANTDGATKITPGSVQPTQPRTITYQQFSNIGKEIKSLSDIESGYDYVVDPITRALNIYNRTNATNFPSTPGGTFASGPSWIYSADRTSTLRFDYGVGKDNLSSIVKRLDGSTVVNRLNVKGKYALGQASDATSQSTYGVFEDVISLPDVVDASTSVLPFYANAEIAFRKNPKVTYDISVKPGDNSPKLFVDFNIGDRGTINTGANVFSGVQTNQAIRIFGVQLSVDAEGNERISGLQLSA